MLLPRILVRATLVAALSTAACLPAAPEQTEAEQQTPPPVDPVPADPTPRPSVRFSPTAHFVDEAGQIYSGQMGAYLEERAPGALVPEASGGFRESLAQHVGVEGYVIPDVPEGPYYLRFNGNHVWTAEREVQLVATVVQRHDLEWSAPAGTALQLRATGLAPWQSSDVLRLSSPNGGSTLEDMRLETADDFGGALPSPGAMELAAHVTRFFVRLEGAKGDSLWVQQLSQRPPSDAYETYTAVVRSFRQPAFSLVPGESTALAASLAGGTERSVSFEIDAQAFDAVQLGAHPRARGPKVDRMSSHAWAIGARPGTEAFARLSSRPELAFGPVNMDRVLQQHRVSFLDDFPQEWLRVMEVTSRAIVSFEVGGRTLAPRLGAPRNLRVNGLDATVKQVGLGSSLVVSWDPPALGTPTRYFVSFLTNTPGSAYLNDVPGFLVTSGTELRLPPELVPSGVPFVIRVAATRGAGLVSPFQGALPLDVAEATTDILTR